MPTISYNTLNGRIVSQASATGGREEFLPDALGSIVQTTHGTNSGGRSLRYGPYGSTLSDSGAWDVPRFEWVGQWGYRTTNLQESEQYVRARHYSSKRGRWTTSDPFLTEYLKFTSMAPSAFLFFLLNPYRYAQCLPTTLIDPLGLAEEGPRGPIQPPEFGGCSSRSYDIPFLEEYHLVLIFGICANCFDNTCCPSNANATLCLTATAGVGFQLSIPIGEFFGIEEMKEDIENLWTSVETLIALLVNSTLGCTVKKKECVKKETEQSLAICIQGCAMLASLALCGQCTLFSSCNLTIGVEVGFCGTPSIGVSVTYNRKKCE